MCIHVHCTMYVCVLWVCVCVCVQVLLEKFRCTDTVVTMLQKRRETCTFNKLKHAVEEMTRR